MNRLSIVLTLAICLAACGPAEQKSPATARAAIQIVAECRAGVRTEQECSRAQAAEAHQSHQEAGSTFRNMAGSK